MSVMPAGEFTWTAAGAWASFLALLGVIARQVGPWRKLSLDAEETFRNGLIQRVQKLEAELARVQRERERDREVRELERSLDRHRLNNITQCFDAMMLMLKASPEKVGDIIVHIEKMREKQVRDEILEKAEIAKARIANGDDVEGELPND